jgi:transposase-like protein
MKQQETQLKLTTEQLQIAIEDQIKSIDGLHTLYELMVNGLMKCERAAFLEEDKSKGNKGNGYRSVTKSGIGNKLSLQIPRDRLGIFKPMIVGMLNEQEEKIKQLCFNLYGKGLTTRQIESVIEDIYGGGYSKSSVSRITTDFSSLVESWRNRQLESKYLVIYIDAIHIKVRRDTVSTEAFYIMLGIKEDYTREVLSVVNMPQESAQGWLESLEQIKKRGVKQVGLFVSDDLAGLDNAIGKEYGKSSHQSCIIHFQRNLSKRVRKTDKEEFCSDVKGVFKPDQEGYRAEDAIGNFRKVMKKWSKLYPGFKKYETKIDLIKYFTYLKYDYRIRRMIYTTNWIERLNKCFRRTLKMRNALPKPEAAITLIGFVSMEMEQGTYSYPITNFKFDEILKQTIRS